MNTLFLGLLALVLGFGLYVRLAPSNPERWHLAPDLSVPAGAVSGEVKPRRGGAVLWLDAAGPEVLARLDQLAMSTPRTRRLAGSVAEGRITWVTRSRLWAFPDYTTAGLTSDGLVLDARLRFGGDDMGVNAKRLHHWLAALGR